MCQNKVLVILKLHPNSVFISFLVLFWVLLSNRLQKN